MQLTPSQSHHILQQLLKAGKIKPEDLPPAYPEQELRAFADWLYTFYNNQDVPSGQAGEKWMSIAEELLIQYDCTEEELFMLISILPICQSLPLGLINIVLSMVGKGGGQGLVLSNFIERRLQSLESADMSASSPAVSPSTMQPDQVYSPE